HLWKIVIFHQKIFHPYKVLLQLRID
ncbi:hypothetical protein XPR_1884, partial [Xanthomonas arboricola pv. pruni MAFF 301420]